MFARISVLLAVAIAVVTSARMERHSHIRRDSTTPNQCNTGSIQCCNSVFNASDFAKIFDELSMSYNPADSFGIDCTPLNLYGAGEAASCQQQPVCCSNNTYEGNFDLFFGCSPIDLN